MKMLIFGFLMSLGWYVAKGVLVVTNEFIDDMIYKFKRKKNTYIRSK